MSELELRATTHRYPGADADAVTGVSLRVPAGRMTSVVGPSGSGKTTLLRVAAGLERPTSGRVTLAGADVTEVATERRDLTVMFQQPHLFDHLDAGGNVAFGPRVAGVGRRESRQRAERYLDLVHLGGLADRPVAALSGGQQQRVALARALATERSTLLLDEPFASLDRELRAQMHDLLGEVREALSPTVLMVTHDLDEAGLAERTVVLIDGVVHQEAPSAVLHAEPATLATARLVGGFTEVVGSVADGVHRSSWGALPLAEGCPVTGDAVLLLRRESLSLAVAPEPPGPGPAGLVGHVTRVRRSGARRVVTVTSLDGSTAEVELGPAQAVPEASDGGEVVVRPRPGLRGWAVSPGPR